MAWVWFERKNNIFKLRKIKMTPMLILIAACVLACAILIYLYCKQDKWIEHGGDKCPVEAGTPTLIKFEDGTEMSVNHPELLAWEYDAHINNIKFYQVLS